MLHKVFDQEALLGEVRQLLKPGGKFLLVEPAGVVGLDQFEAEVKKVRLAGLNPVSQRKVSLSKAMVFV